MRVEELRRDAQRASSAAAAARSPQARKALEDRAREVWRRWACRGSAAVMRDDDGSWSWLSLALIVAIVVVLGALSAVACLMVAR